MTGVFWKPTSKKGQAIASLYGETDRPVPESAYRLMIDNLDALEKSSLPPNKVYLISVGQSEVTLEYTPRRIVMRRRILFG